MLMRPCSNLEEVVLLASARDNIIIMELRNSLNAVIFIDSFPNPIFKQIATILIESQAAISCLCGRSLRDRCTRDKDPLRNQRQATQMYDTTKHEDHHGEKCSDLVDNPSRPGSPTLFLRARVATRYVWRIAAGALLYAFAFTDLPREAYDARGNFSYRFMSLLK